MTSLEEIALCPFARRSRYDLARGGDAASSLQEITCERDLAQGDASTAGRQLFLSSEEMHQRQAGSSSYHRRRCINCRQATLLIIRAYRTY